MKFVHERVGLSTSVGGAIAIVVIIVIGLLIYASTRPPSTSPSSSTTSSGTCTVDCSSSSALITSSSVTSSPSSNSTSSSSNSTSSMSVAGAVVAMPKGAGAGQSAAPGFTPYNITVIIGVNNTVTWTNNDTVSHTVYSSSVPSGATTFMSPIIPANGTYSYTFTVPGTYEYYCSLHSWMKGTIIVQANPTPK